IGVGVKDAMTACFLSCSNSGELDGHNFIVEQSNDPAYRTDKALRLGGAPVHILGPVNRSNLLGQSFGEYVSGGAAFAGDGCCEILALGCADLFQCPYIDASFLCECMSRRCGLAVFVCDLGCRTGELLSRVRL